ncbi:2-hydroxyacid dehydrogenase [Coprobacter sp.]
MSSIVFFGAKPYDITSFDAANKDFGFKIKYYKGNLNRDNLVLAKGADVVCIFVNDNADAEIIQALSENGTKLLALRCAGYNNVDLKAAQEYGMKVVRVPAYSPHAVAEYTLALMLTLNRKIHRASWRTRDGNFSLHGLMGFDMYNKTAGIIGTGKIAKILIRILRGFGMNVLGYDLYPDKKFADEVGMTYTSLDELYADSDIISLHCPLTPETDHMIDKSAISKMKKGVMIINTGRGRLIDTNDLIDGLKEKIIGSAALDVYEEENSYFYIDRSDYIIDDDVLARLLSFNNVIVTSHQAFFTQEAMANIANTTLQNIRDYRDGIGLQNEVKIGS